MQLLVQNRPLKRGSVDDCLVAHLELAAQRKTVPRKAMHVRRAHNAAFLFAGDLLILAALVQLAALPAVVALACLTGFAIRGLYPGWGLDRRAELSRQLGTLLAVFGLWVLFAAPNVATVAFTLPSVLLLLPIARRAVKRVLLASGLFGMPIAIYGAGSDGRRLLELLRSHADIGFIPVGFLDDHPAYWGAHVLGLPVLGDTNVVLTQAWVGVLAMPDVEQGFRQYLLEGPLSCYPHAYDLSDGDEPLRTLQDASCRSLMERLAGRILQKTGS